MKKNKNLIFSVLALLIVIGFIMSIGVFIKSQLEFFPDHILSLFGTLLLMYAPLPIALEAALFGVKYFMEIKKPKALVIHIANIGRLVAAVGYGVIYVLTFEAKVLFFKHYIVGGYICAGIIAALGIAEIVIALVNAKKLKK